MKKKQEQVQEQEQVQSVSDKLASGYYDNHLPYGPGLAKKTIAEGNAMRKAWGDEEGRLRTLFRKDCAEEFGVTGHRKEPLVFDVDVPHVIEVKSQ